MTNHRDKTITYIDCATDTVLDTERAKQAPKRGQHVTFLETAGIWQVNAVASVNGSGKVVRVGKVT